MSHEYVPHPALHLVCGKIAAGKSTLTRRLAANPGTVVLSEDAWLSRLYPDEIRELADYVRCSGQLRGALTPHIESLLQAGLSVVLDFPANTLASRRWMKGIIDRTGVAHVLHYLDTPDEVCKSRLRDRNAEGSPPYAPTEAEFDTISSYFVPPSSDEGFHAIRYDGASAD